LLVNNHKSCVFTACQLTFYWLPQLVGLSALQNLGFPRISSREIKNFKLQTKLEKFNTFPRLAFFFLSGLYSRQDDNLESKHN